MPRLILLRHGQSQWNLENRFTGWVDVDLTAEGEAQARRGGELIAEAGFKPAVMFTSVLTRAKRTGADYVISDEREKLLETGGGLVKALPLIGDKPFLCVNADVLWVDGPTDAISALSARWDPEIMDALLLLVPFARANGYPGMGDFHMDADGKISRRKSGRVAPFVYCSVQILSPKLIVDPPADMFSTGIFWDRAIAAGRAYGLSHGGMWYDVGTPAAIPLVEAGIADG